MNPIGLPRRRLNAMLLSFLSPGLGDLYAGYPRSAALTFAAYYVIAALAVALVFAPLHGLLAMLPVLVSLGAFVMSLVRAARAATRAPQPYPLQPYNRWYWYLAGILFSLLLWQPTLLRVMRTRWVQAFRTPSGAMEPTLWAGDFFFVSRRPSDRRPRQNDLVVVVHGGLSIVKRVVGLPSDTLSMRDGLLTRNGVDVPEPFTQLVDPSHVAALDEGRAWQVKHLVGASARTYRPNLRNWGPIVVPPDSVFVLGDNRDNSYDSRYWGPVAINRIRGKALVVYFSIESEPFSIRWDRIGHRF